MKRLENEGPEEKRWMVEKKEKRISHKNAVLSTFWVLFLLINKKCVKHERSEFDNNSSKWHKKVGKSKRENIKKSRVSIYVNLMHISAVNK